MSPEPTARKRHLTPRETEDIRKEFSEGKTIGELAIERSRAYSTIQGAVGKASPSVARRKQRKGEQRAWHLFESEARSHCYQRVGPDVECVVIPPEFYECSDIACYACGRQCWAPARKDQFETHRCDCGKRYVLVVVEQVGPLWWQLDPAGIRWNLGCNVPLPPVPERTTTIGARAVRHRAKYEFPMPADPRFR